MVDFQNITIAARELYYILPYQVHYRIITNSVEGWFLAIDTSLVPVQSFLAMAASTNDAVQSGENKHSRSAELVRKFRKLLAANIHTIKKPSVYASKLNVSTGYLNEAIKKATGSSVSYWIQQEVFIEAKRLLYHNDAAA